MISFGVEKGDWPEADSNCRHEDFQSTALPTELSGRWVLLNLFMMKIASYFTMVFTAFSQWLNQIAFDLSILCYKNHPDSEDVFVFVKNA